MVNPFSKQYQQLSAAQLLEILQKHDDYQPLALEAARSELESRNLSEDELNTAENIIVTADNEKEEKKWERHQQINRIATGIRSYLVVDEDAPTSKQINIISLILAVVVLYLIIDRFDYYIFLLSNPELFEESGGWSELFLLLTVIIFPGIGGFLFWKRKGFGWKLLAVYFFASLIFGLISLQYVSWTPAENPLLHLFDLSPVSALLSILFFGGMFWTICKQEIRGSLTINNTMMYWTIAVAAAVTLLVWFALHS
jgi:hypothetical protein